MPHEDQSARLAALRDAEMRGTLTPSEREELDALFDALDAEEASEMSAATALREGELAALRDEIDRVRATARALERVRDAQRDLLVEAQDYTARLRARRIALADEAHALLRRAGTER